MVIILGLKILYHEKKTQTPYLWNNGDNAIPYCLWWQR